jgi:outer membrane protein OmpA-like peptidoglycan-associated protein
MWSFVMSAWVALQAGVDAPTEPRAAAAVGQASTEMSLPAIVFAPGGSTTKAAVRTSLEATAKELQQRFKDNDAATAIVEVHTDFCDNDIALAQTRADHVVALLGSWGLDVARLRTLAKGHREALVERSRPLVERAANRRVRLLVVSPINIPTANNTIAMLEPDARASPPVLTADATIAVGFVDDDGPPSLGLIDDWLIPAPTAVTGNTGTAPQLALVDADTPFIGFLDDAATSSPVLGTVDE